MRQVKLECGFWADGINLLGHILVQIPATISPQVGVGTQAFHPRGYVSPRFPVGSAHKRPVQSDGSDRDLFQRRAGRCSVLF